MPLSRAHVWGVKNDGSEIARRYSHTVIGNIASDVVEVTYDERPVEDAMELHELIRLRTELCWADWKAHTRFKKDRLLCDAARRWGATGSDSIPFGVFAGLREGAPSNDDQAALGDEVLSAALAGDAVYAERCDAQRDAWIEAMEAQGPDCDETDNDAPRGARGETR